MMVNKANQGSDERGYVVRDIWQARRKKNENVNENVSKESSEGALTIGDK